MKQDIIDFLQQTSVEDLLRLVAVHNFAAETDWGSDELQTEIAPGKFVFINVNKILSVIFVKIQHTELAAVLRNWIVE